MSDHELDALLERVAEARRFADSQVLGWQRKLRPGDLCLSYNKDVELFVFHESLDPLSYVSDEEEREYLRKTYAQETMANYRFTRSYSAICPDGELGDIHVSIVSCVVPPSVWEQCQTWQWHGHDAIHALLKQQASLIRQLMAMLIRRTNHQN